MNEQKRMTSIARRINRNFMLRLFFVLLTVNMLMCVLTVAGWCYTAETYKLGSTWVPNLIRSFKWDEEQPFWNRLETIVYSFSSEGKDIVYSINGGSFFSLTAKLLFILLCLEGIILFIQYGAGKRRAQILLKPLHQMAETAQQLSTARFDEQKYHDLEDAIARISPDAPDARLATGDRDLQGLEEAVNSLLKRMRDSYREQVRFVSDASHELRTPIAVIQGYANMLDRWGKNDEKILTESITAIKAESDNMQKLVEQLLFLARGDSGRTKINFERTDLSALLQEVYEESQMIYPEHSWNYACEEKVFVSGDSQLLKQAARILTQNAAKFTPSGGRIIIKVFENTKKESCFSVQDNGIGISQEDLPHIFERFYRSDPARKRSTGGTGLGLAISKWIIEGHSGYFDILSRVDFGTRITVCMPGVSAADQPRDMCI